MLNIFIYFLNLDFIKSIFNFLSYLNECGIFEILAIITSSIISCIAIKISIDTLKQSNKAIEESSRANIVFYIDTPTGSSQYLVLKNFGNSPGKLKKMEISPKLDLSKTDYNNAKLITDSNNILLAPNQVIKSWFPFKEYPDKQFNVSITYETLGKTYTDNYSINIDYLDNINYLFTATIDNDTVIKNLNNINNNLIRITERINQ